MAIKEVTIVCPHEGADKGKQFIIKRMSAVEADRWGRHVLQAAAIAGADLPEAIEANGLAAVAAAGIRIFAGMPPETADTLLDRLMQCVSLVPDLAHPEVLLPWSLAQSQIEEIPTIGWLHKEALKLHLDFFKGVGRLFSLLTLMLGMENSGPTPDQPTSDTQ